MSGPCLAGRAFARNTCQRARPGYAPFMISGGRRISWLSPSPAALVLALFVVSCPGEGRSQGTGSRKADPPLVDMTAVDFSNSVAEVPVVWDFYWMRLLGSGDFRGGTESALEPDERFYGMQPWTSAGMYKKKFPADGYGTYRMFLRLPPGREYGLHIQQQYTSSRLFIDGKLSPGSGQIGTTPAEDEPQRGHRTAYFSTEKGTVEIIIHVSNFQLFRGGLRGNLMVGARNVIDRYVFRRIAFEIGMIGFFLALLFLHLTFFLTRIRDQFFLYFALICLSFALRIPFMGETVIDLLVAPPTWEFQLRTLFTLNVLSPPLLMVFLRSVFPDTVNNKTVVFYTFGAALFLCAHFTGMRGLAPAQFLLYLIVLVPLLLHAGLITTRAAARGSVSARIMAVGMLLLCILGFFAMYLNWRASDAAVDYAYLTFITFGLFQSVALGAAYRENLVARESLTLGLARSQAALAVQRRELEINLHDTLGGALTDLKIQAERGLDAARKGESGSSRDSLVRIHERLEVTTRMFRGQLLFMEDIELAARDPITGLHMSLLRRYSDAGREIIFDVNERTQTALIAAMRDDEFRMNLLQLSREICTNDLKYGAGDSNWSIHVQTLRPGGPLHLVIDQNNTIAGEPDSGAAARRAALRAEKMGGTCQARVQDARYHVRVSLPAPSGRILNFIK